MKQRNKEASQLKGDNEKSPLKQEMRAQYSMQQRACVARISYSALACPKLSLEPARQFRLDFEWRELRKRPTSACSKYDFITSCGRGLRGIFRPLRPRPRSSDMAPKPTSACAHVAWTILRPDVLVPDLAIWNQRKRLSFRGLRISEGRISDG